MTFQRITENGIENIECDMIQPLGNLADEDANKMVFYLYKETKLVAIVPVVEFFTIC